MDEQCGYRWRVFGFHDEFRCTQPRGHVTGHISEPAAAPHIQVVELPLAA